MDPLNPFGQGSPASAMTGIDTSVEPAPEIDIWHVNDRLLDTDPEYKKKLLEATKLAADRAVAAKKAAETENPLLRKFASQLHTPITPFEFMGDLNPLNALKSEGSDGPALTPEPQADETAPLDRVSRAVIHGTLDATNEMARTATEIGAGVTATALEHGLGDRSPEDKKAFFDWYKKGSANWTVTDPVTGTQILRSKKEYSDWAGPQQGGVYGFIDDLTQFSVASETMGAGLDVLGDVPVLGKAVSALNKTRMLRGGLKGVLGQMAAFDPYESRLSSMIANGPDWFGKDAIAVLAPSKDDGPAMARIKNGLEGYLTAQAIDGVLFGLKLGKLKFLASSKKINAEEAAAALAKLKGEFPHLFDEAGNSIPEGEVTWSDEPAKVTHDAETGLHKVEVDIPEGDVKWSDEPPKPGAGTLEATGDFEPRPLDFEHQPVKDAAALKPTSITIGLDAKGNRVIRAIDTSGSGAPKVFDVPFDDPNAAETVKQWRGAAEKPSVYTPARAIDKMSDAERAVWDEANKLLPKPAGEAPVVEPTQTVVPTEPPTKAGIPSAKAAEDAAAVAPTVISKQPVVESVHANPASAEAEAASFNMAVKNLRNSGKLFLDEKAKQAFKDALEAYNKNGDTRSVAQLLKDYGFNTGYIQQPDNVINTLKALVDQAPEVSAKARAVPTTWATLKAKIAAIYPEIADNDGALRSAAKLFGGVEKLPEHLAAMRVWMWHQAGEIGKLAKLAEAFPDNAKLADQLAASMDTLFQVHAKVSGATTKSAQTVQSLQMPLGELTAKLTASRAAGAAGEAAADAVTHRAPGTYPVIANLTRGEIQALGHLVGEADSYLDKTLALIAGPKAADLNAFGNKLAPQVQRSWASYVNEYRVEALLSSAPTQLGNVINNLGVAVKRPLQYFWAGVELNDPKLVQEGQDMLSGLVLHLYESAKLATKAFKTGENVFDASSSSADNATKLLSMESSALKYGKDTPGNLMALLYKMPSRMLMTADEFFKQLNGRAFMRAQILKGVREAGITDSAVVSQKLRDGMKMAFDPNGGAIHPGMIAYAQDATYTKDLPPKLKKLMDAIGSSEIGKFILPFRKTPTNIFLHAWEEAPGLNMLNKQMVDDLNAGGRSGALARAKADTGAVLWGLATWLAVSGKITGHGPTDPELRKQWMGGSEGRPGHQPYSISIAGKQFSYRRGDPFTSALGVAADVISMSGELDDNSKASAMALGLTALANNVTNKTFMQTVSDALDAFSSGDPKQAEAFFSNAVGSLVPNVLTHANPDDVQRETQPTGDGLMREIDLAMNAFMSRTPGFSDKLPPRRNIFGEKVMKAPGWNNRFFNPFQFMDAPKDNDVAQELLKLGKAMPMPAESVAGGRIDLRDGKLFNDRGGQSPYDRQLEMMASPPWGGRPLRDVVEKMVKSDAYKKAKDTNAWGPGGTRYMLVSEVIQAYHQMAHGQLMKEYPSLTQAMLKDGYTDATGIMGGRSAAQDEMKKYDDLFKQ